MKTVIRYINAKTGRYVTKEYAGKHPGTTVGMKVRMGSGKHNK